ncbi:metallo-beta-lactamase domain protein [Apiospora arundinis]
MDELEELYLGVFTGRRGDYYFKKPSAERRYKAVTITASAGEAEATDYQKLELAEDALVDYMSLPGPEDQNAQPLPRLQLIILERGPGFSCVIASDVFKGVLRAASISTEGLWVILQDLDGLHSVRRLEDTDAHFAGHTWYTIAWSFNRRSLCTKVIWIDGNDGREYPKFIFLLQCFQKYISSPFLVGYLYCLSTTMIDLANRVLYRDIEQSIGYDVYKNETRPARPSRLDLSELTHHISLIHHQFDLVGYHQHTLNNSIQIINDLNAQAHAASLEEVDANPTKQKMNSSSLQLSQAFPAVRSRLMAQSTQLQRYKQRGVELCNLTCTYFGKYSHQGLPIHMSLFCDLDLERKGIPNLSDTDVLLTHEDALKGADLAKLGAEIAAASKRDSASMKTVTVLTMAFLPATFFAALFAIPSLDWKGAADRGGPVIQSNFWVYWAFTLPATVLVFVIWIILDNRARLMGMYREKVLGLYKERVLGKKLRGESEEHSSANDTGSGYFYDGSSGSGSGMRAGESLESVRARSARAGSVPAGPVGTMAWQHSASASAMTV